MVFNKDKEQNNQLSKPFQDLVMIYKWIIKIKNKNCNGLKIKLNIPIELL